MHATLTNRLCICAVVLSCAAAGPACGQDVPPVRHHAGHSTMKFAPTVTNTSAGPVRVPIEVHQEAKILLVRARVGKNLAGWFVVDTGAATTVVTPEFARKLRGEYPRLTEWVGPAQGTNEPSRVILLPLLALGAMRFEDFMVTTASLEHLSKQLKTQLDGIIGGNILFARRCAFSVLSRRLVFDAPVPVNVKPVACAAGSWQLGVPVTADGQTELFLLDSGASRSVLPENEWHGAVVDSGRVMRSDISETVVGVKTCTAVIKDLRIGGTPLPWLKLTLADNPQRLLGIDFINHFLLTIDAEQGKIWLQPPSPYVQ